MLTVLLAILTQTVHSYEHFSGNKIALHNLDDYQTDLHQNDHNHQQCFVCEFTFNNFIAVEGTSITFETSTVNVAYSFFYSEKPSFFSGSHSSLRGPPQTT